MIFYFFLLEIGIFCVRAPCGSSEDPYNQDASRCRNNSHLLNIWAQTSGSSYLLLSWMLGRRSDAAEHDVDWVKLTFVLLDIKCQAWKLSTRSNQFMLDSRWVAAVNLGTIPEGVPETGRQTDRQTRRVQKILELFKLLLAVIKTMQSWLVVKLITSWTNNETSNMKKTVSEFLSI